MDSERKLFKRDISWLSFNYRVLMEAKDDSLPLFERIKFLSIYSSNLEEFFRIRVSEHRKVLSDNKSSDDEKNNAQRTLYNINLEIENQLKEFDSFFQNDIMDELARNHLFWYRNAEVADFTKYFVKIYIHH